MTRMRRIPMLLVLVLVLVAAACSGGTATGDLGPDLATITVDEFEAEIGSSDRPMVVNLWASWCIPCRSEAPLLRQAHATFSDDIRFLGIATEDSPRDSLAFLDEFRLTFDNRSDRPGAIRGHLGAVGLPVTIFVRPGGEILRTHFGVIDDAALALGIDDLLTDG
ncbi:MAG: TlpA disulfide reductase family protein [Acidimicrobiia bacterium]